MKEKEQLLNELTELMGRMTGVTNPYKLNKLFMDIGDWLNKEVDEAYSLGKEEAASWEKQLPKN